MPKINAFAPSGLLKSFVSSLVHIEDMGIGIALQRVYQVIIINLGDDFGSSNPYLDEEVRYHPAKVWINGMHQTPFALHNSGKVNFYVIGVKPGMLSFLINCAVADTNGNAHAAAYWADEDILQLRSELKKVSYVEGFSLIEAYLLKKVKPVEAQELEKISYLAHAMFEVRVDEMCQKLNCSRKKLSADSKKYFGAPIKVMQGIVRFDRHLAEISHSPTATLSRVHRFYDQAHFINDFKARTGMSPSQYRALCRAFPQIASTPNFIPIAKETFLQFLKQTPL